MITYDVNISPRVAEQIKSIRNYIADIKLNQEAADSVVDNIFDEIETLAAYPERGFDADAKLGVKIDEQEKTYGIIILEGKYIVLYATHEEDTSVNVVYLLSTQTDYARYFLK